MSTNFIFDDKQRENRRLWKEGAERRGKMTKDEERGRVDDFELLTANN